MKQVRFSFLSAALLLSVILCITAMPMRVQASSYSSSWKLWTQGQSSNSKMKKSGCRIVSFAKLLKDTGLATDPGFNPDTFLYWCQHTYNPKQKCVFVFPGQVSQNGDAQDPIVTYNQQVGGSLVYAGRRFLSGNTRQRKQQAVDAVNQGYYVLIGGTAHFSYVDRELTSQYQKLWVDDSGIDYSSLATWNGNANVYEVNATICRHGMGAYDSLYLFYLPKAQTQTQETTIAQSAEEAENQESYLKDVSSSSADTAGTTASTFIELAAFRNQPVSSLQSLIPTLTLTNTQADLGMLVYTSPLYEGTKGCITTWTDAGGLIKNLQLTSSSLTQYAVGGISSGMNFADVKAVLQGIGWQEVADTPVAQADGVTRQAGIFEAQDGSQLLTTSHQAGDMQVVDSVTLVSVAE